MKPKLKIATNLATFANQIDRFCTAGYKSDKSVEEMFNDASKIKDLSGIELVGNYHINENNISLIKKLKSDLNFNIVSILPEIFIDKKWKNGSFSSKDQKIRKMAIEEVKKCIDFANELDCEIVNIWPGQDGFDYSFQTDYLKSWAHIVDGIQECARYRNDIKLSIEYKTKEPRTHCHIGTIGKTLKLIEKIDEKNVGVTVDVGHAFYAYENVAETIALCSFYGNKLFHIHLNDNYGFWDDDLMIGSVHTQEYLEIIYWLKKVDYRGWYSFDTFPSREDGIGATIENIEWFKSMGKAVDSINENEFDRVINSDDAIESLKLLRQMIFPEK